MTIYSYGWMAWVWRVFASVGIAAAALFAALAILHAYWWGAAIAAIFGLPSTLLPWVLAVRIDWPDKDRIVVTNLFWVRRRIPCAKLGRVRVKMTAQAALGHVAAPRAWVAVKRRLPIYLDLWAPHIDRAAFGKVFGLRRLPRG